MKMSQKLNYFFLYSYSSQIIRKIYSVNVNNIYYYLSLKLRMQQQNNNKQQEENQKNQIKKFLSVNSAMCIPFISMSQFEKIFFIFYVVIFLLSFAYKYNRLIYPSYAAVTQLLMISLFIFSQMIKIEFALKGVNNRHPQSIRSYLIISVFVILSYIFFLRLQTYVNMIQIITNSIGLGYTAIESGLATWLLIIFYRKRKIV